MATRPARRPKALKSIRYFTRCGGVADAAEGIRRVGAGAATTPGLRQRCRDDGRSDWSCGRASACRGDGRDDLRPRRVRISDASRTDATATMRHSPAEADYRCFARGATAVARCAPDAASPGRGCGSIGSGGPTWRRRRHGAKRCPGLVETGCGSSLWPVHGGCSAGLRLARGSGGRRLPDGCGNRRSCGCAAPRSEFRDGPRLQS